MADISLYKITRYCNKIIESTGGYDCEYSFDRGTRNLMIKIYDSESEVIHIEYNTVSKKSYAKVSSGVATYTVQALIDLLKEYAYADKLIGGNY